MSTAPTPAPQKKDNLVWWFIGLVVVAVAVLGLGGILAAYFIRQNVEVIRTDNQVEVRTPAGELKVARNAHVDPGLPVYPGAMLTEPGATVELTSPEEDSLFVTSARYRTPDPIQNVDAWYRENLSLDFEREGPGKMEKKKEVVGIMVKSSDTAYISDKEDALRVVVLERKGLYTEIALARLSKQEPQ